LLELYSSIKNYSILRFIEAVLLRSMILLYLQFGDVPRDTSCQLRS